MAYKYRLLFNNKEVRVLLITERFLYYWWQFHVRGTQNVMFYGCPEQPYTYLNVLSWVQTPSSCHCLTLSTLPNDAFSLERILGTKFFVQKIKDARTNATFAFS